MRRLVELRTTGTIGEVIDLLKETRKPRLPDAVLRTEKRLAEASREEIDSSRTLAQIEKLRPLPYSELMGLADFINDHTPFSTKHGVKGAEFDNVPRGTWSGVEPMQLGSVSRVVSKSVSGQQRG